uniref:AP-5 complex subunit beta-1 n=1 Tax=Cyprinodon variegatus TaxID=28743 RepID=A0A3Q2CXB1_CYPVA
ELTLILKVFLALVLLTLSGSLQVLLLVPLCEHPFLLCSSESAGEETALDLMSVFLQCPPRSQQFRCHLLVALTSVLICSSCAGSRSRASLDFLDLLLQVAQDTSDHHGDSSPLCLRNTAAECLREMEASCPGLLSQRLELLGGLRQQETSRLHQAYAGLQVLVLRNAVLHLTKESGAGAAQLKALLGGPSCADQDVFQMDANDPAVQASLVLGPMGRVPTLPTGPDCKELRSILSSLLEESYLLSPLCQAALLHRLIEVVAMAPGIPPAIFRAQLLRLLGTNQVALLHVTLLMKCAFTDSLFSAEDEAFLLKRLLVLSQHPVLSASERLFYMDCILHFPENRPISCGDSDEALPVLLTPQLASILLPTVLNDSATLLARLHLQALVFLEDGEEEGGGGLAYIYDLLGALLHMVDRGGSRDLVVTFFRAAFLFLLYFHHVERYSARLSQQLCQLYLQHPLLAPHILNLADRTQDHLPESDWAVGLLQGLQRAITGAPGGQLTLPDLSCHLKVLSRAAEEGNISPCSTLRFLSAVFTSSLLCSGSNWCLGNGVLGVCRRVLLHPSLDSLFGPLADVLLHLACNYGDSDIQDHARLYFSLLTTLSREKLSAVLQGAAEGQVKKRALSCVMAESEGLTNALSVHQTDRAVLRLTEAGPGPLQEPLFEQLFSIRLHFRLTDHHYHPLPDASVPLLHRQRPPPELTLTLQPRRPHPTTIRVAAIFTAKDGLTWHSDMPDLHVAFQQTFLPLPVPSTWSRASRVAVFEALWEEAESEAGVWAVSLFCCQLGEAHLKALLQTHFLPFLLSDSSLEDGFRVLWFLPPRSHVLLKISREDDATLFKMATDDRQLLPHINDYLLEVTSTAAIRQLGSEPEHRS